MAIQRMTFSCDLRCGASESTEKPLPEGWTQVTINEAYEDQGFPDRHVCPNCSNVIASRAVANQHPHGLVARITNHLVTGGLFNPELMDPEKVRDLLFDRREQLASTQNADC